MAYHVLKLVLYEQPSLELEAYEGHHCHSVAPVATCDRRRDVMHTALHTTPKGDVEGTHVAVDDREPEQPSENGPVDPLVVVASPDAEIKDFGTDHGTHSKPPGSFELPERGEVEPPAHVVQVGAHHPSPLERNAHVGRLEGERRIEIEPADGTGRRQVGDLRTERGAEGPTSTFDDLLQVVEAVAKVVHPSFEFPQLVLADETTAFRDRQPTGVLEPREAVPELTEVGLAHDFPLFGGAGAEVVEAAAHAVEVHAQAPDVLFEVVDPGGVALGEVQALAGLGRNEQAEHTNEDENHADHGALLGVEWISGDFQGTDNYSIKCDFCQGLRPAGKHEVFKQKHAVGGPGSTVLNKEEVLRTYS